MILLIVLVVLVVSGLVIWAAHACLWGMTLNTEIKPLEVVSLAVTIAIAFLLQDYITNKTTDLRSEKDLLIGNINDLIAVLKTCRDTLEGCDFRGKILRSEKRQIVQSLRRASNAVGHLESTLNMSQCKELSTEMKSIRDACFRYKIAATSYPFPTKPTPLALQDRAIGELLLSLQSLMFKINKHH